MEKVIVESENAPKAVGPYSQAVKYGQLIFLSGQIAQDINTGKLIKGTVEEQTEIILNSIKEILYEAESSLDKVLKCNVYLSNIDNFNSMNNIYKKFFENDFPARLTVSKVDIFGDLDVEIDVIAGI